VVNSQITHPGTLGFVAVDEGDPTQRFIVSNYHVLVRLMEQPGVQDEPIFQGSGSDEAVAFVDLSRADTGLDCAAARVADNIETSRCILGLGLPGPPMLAQVGMRVVKSGLSTGVTEGVVTEVSGDRVRLEVPQGFPEEYELSDLADSGSLWLELETRAAVALHVRGNFDGPEWAEGIAIHQVLHALRLRM
jgi:endonuclease G